MGPRFDERGKESKLPCPWPNGIASMGPRFDERGKRPSDDYSAPSSQSFNGAALLMSRGKAI